MITKPLNPKGTRDFNSRQLYKRDYLFTILRNTFEKYGFQPIETPAMENLESLTGKYGEEGDQLLFKVLNNGDFLSKVDTTILEQKDSKAATSYLSKRGMRYDLTIPFARFVSQYQNELTFPFKRYQIQPVWRADRPQKGRYQEFYQCDCDVIGSVSLLYEAELLRIYDEVFHRLNLEVVIKINNRKILFGISETAGMSDKFVEITTIIDKLDKIGERGVVSEFEERQYPSASIEIILKCIRAETPDDIERIFEGKSITGQKGIEEIREVLGFLNLNTVQNTIKFDASLARGLTYYTGCVVEVEAKNASMGSIGGGGRYDDLTGSFGLKNMSGVGISFGAERIYDVLEELNLFPADIYRDIELIFLSYDKDCLLHAFGLATAFREAGMRVDVYPEAVKMGKQFKYADSKNVPFVMVIGPEEINSGNYTLKEMSSGNQQYLSKEEIISYFRG